MGTYFFIPIYIQQDATLHSLFISGNCSKMFRVIPPPIIRSAYNCIYSVWFFVTLLLLPASIVEELELLNYGSNSSTIAAGSSNGVTKPDAVDKVVCVPDDGWRYYPKYVEQFSYMNKLCNVASCCIYIYILEYTYDARTHKL
jgi:hypothetical protein